MLFTQYLNHLMDKWISMVVIFVRNFTTIIPHRFRTVIFRLWNSATCLALNAYCKNIDQTFAVLFFEVAFVLIMQIKTWKLRNHIFFFLQIFKHKHFSDSSVFRCHVSAAATITLYSCNLCRQIHDRSAHNRDHSMLTVELWIDVPAREIDVWTYLWHELIDFILY